MRYNPAVSNTFSDYSHGVSIGPSLPGEGEPARKAQRGTRNHHWDHLLTLGFAGQGYLKDKLEQRTAVAYEPRGKQFLLFGQWWWRDFFSLPIDLSAGLAWYPNSRFNDTWTNLNFFTERNQIWLEVTYYLL